jgi:hypothetical protein
MELHLDSIGEYKEEQSTKHKALSTKHKAHRMG